MTLAVQDHRFPVQRVTQDEWTQAAAANAAADALAGFETLAKAFLAGRREPALRELARNLDAWSPGELAQYVEATRGHSLVMLVMMLTGACNADCPICFTDRRVKPGELDAATRDRVLREARALGARFVYVPGEGEPTIDTGFWSMLDTCRAIGLHAIVFTNGIVFSDPESCRRLLHMETDEAIARLAEYPVSLYHKLWSFDPALVAEMMHIPITRYRFARAQGHLVPEGLLKLIDALPASRVGIEVVVERRNADEVVEAIVPFADALHLFRIVEMVQHNGRTLGNGVYDPSPAQVVAATPLLSPTSCALAPCKAVVTSRGWLSPRIAVLEHQIPGVPADVRTASLFDLLRSDYLARHRYKTHECLCETLPLACLHRASTVTVPLIPVDAVAEVDACGAQECPR